MGTPAAKLDRHWCGIGSNLLFIAARALWLLPYALVTVVGALVGHSWIDRRAMDDQLEPGVYLGVAVLVALIVCRHVLALLEKRRLQLKLNASAQRTEHLNADLLAMQEELRTVYGIMACSVLVVDACGTILYANATAGTVLGRPEEDLAGQPFLAAGWVVTAADGTSLAPAQYPTAIALRTGRPVHQVTIGLTSRDGQHRRLQVDAAPLHARGAELQVVVSLVDLTGRVQAEAALRQSEARFRGAFDEAAIGMFLVAPSGRLLQVNPALCALLGYSKEELLALDFQALTHPDDLPASLAHARRLLDGETKVGLLEKRYLHQDGHSIWVQLSSSLQRDEAGQPLYFINQLQDVTERKAAEAMLRHQASHDSLTGLPNRVRLHECLESAVQSGSNAGRPVSLLLLDLDRFKEVNDTLGHHMGDLLLRQVATRLQHAIGATETIARLGGDEFAIVLPGADAPVATTVARLVLGALEAPFQLEGQPLEIGGSIGIAVYPEHSADVHTLLQQGDVAMYEAKRAHCGYAVYEERQERHSIRRLTLMHDLRLAIREDGLTLVYQPQITLSNGQLCGVEALARWPHPVHGLLPPDQFIPLAERTGLIFPLTEWVLRTALRQQQAWRAAGRAIPVAVNLSVRTLQDQQLPEIIAHLLEQFGAAPRDLTLEITESSLMADPVRARDVLARLHRLGVRLAIDDFGTGYSSLGYLKDLPVDEVKIDKSFVLGMGERAATKDAAIVRSVVAMAHALGLGVVAEGVESAQASTLLRSLQCDAIQGYFVGRPVPAAELERQFGAARPPGNEQACVLTCNGITLRG